MHGRTAYEAYCGETGNRSLVTGSPLPPWGDLSESIRAAWEAAGRAVAMATMAGDLGHLRTCLTCAGAYHPKRPCPARDFDCLTPDCPEGTNWTPIGYLAMSGGVPTPEQMADLVARWRRDRDEGGD